VARKTTTTAKQVKAPASVRISLPGVGSWVLHNDWTARVAARCRLEMGMTPEQLLGEISTPDKVSADTVVRLVCFARWQAGEDVTYD
jgi:hypothetical protein